MIDRDTGDAIRRINELEYVDDYIYANVWYAPGFKALLCA